MIDAAPELAVEFIGLRELQCVSRGPGDRHSIQPRDDVGGLPGQSDRHNPHAAGLARQFRPDPVVRAQNGHTTAHRLRIAARGVGLSVRGQEQVRVPAHPRHQAGYEIDRLMQMDRPAQIMPRHIVRDRLPHVAGFKDVHAEIHAPVAQRDGGGNEVLRTLHRDQPAGMDDPQQPVPPRAGLHF